jgi:hypothetical protein
MYYNFDSIHFTNYLHLIRSRCTSVSTVSDWTIGVRSRQRQRIFPLASMSRPALGPTQPPVQWVPAVLSPGLKVGQGVTLTTDPHLAPRSRMSRIYNFLLPRPLSSCMASSGADLLLFFFL